MCFWLSYLRHKIHTYTLMASVLMVNRQKMNFGLGGMIIIELDTRKMTHQRLASHETSRCPLGHATSPSSFCVCMLVSPDCEEVPSNASRLSSICQNQTTSLYLGEDVLKFLNSKDCQRYFLHSFTSSSAPLRTFPRNLACALIGSAFAPASARFTSRGCKQ